MAGEWCASRFTVQVARGETPRCTKGRTWAGMEKCLQMGLLVLLICVTRVVKSAFDKALAEHEDINDAVSSEEPTECDHGVDFQQPLLIKIDSSDNHQK
ncbi:hypothetical protein OROMI_018257 [Orobanche minor]